MLRGYYIASNGLINQQKTLNTISNNIANVQTAGYKADTSMKNTFKRELILLGQGRRNTTGTIEYQFTESSYTGLDQGTFEFTKRPLDVAIQGPVYFNIKSNAGKPLLTRDGQFSVDDEGYLALDGAGRVQGDNGDIYVGKSDFTVKENGEIFIGGNRADKLALTYIEDTKNVQKVGNNTFTALGGAGGEIPQEVKYSVIQGAYERSNVDPAVEMTRAIAAQRSFEAMAKVVTQLDKINQRTATELAKV